MKIFQGNIITGPPIVLGDTTWTDVNSFTSTTDLSIGAGTDLNFSSSTGNINFIAITGQVNLVSDLDCTFGSVSGSFFMTANSQMVFTATTGDIDLTATAADIVLTAGGAISLASSTRLGGNGLYFGTGDESVISYSTNMLINPDSSGSGGGGVYIGDGTTPRRIKAEAITLGDNTSAYSGVRAININQTSSTYSNGMFCSMNFSGSTVTARAMNMSMNHSGGSATTASVANLFTSMHSVEPTGTVTMEGFRGIATTSIPSTTGTKIYRGVVGAPAIGTGHTGGTIRSVSIYAVGPTGSGGSSTYTRWGMLSEDDVQINSDNKLILEGSTTTKGDSYAVFNSATTDIDWFVDNTKIWNWDNDLNVSEVPLGTKAGTSTTYAKVGGTIDVNTTAVGNVGTGEDDLITYSIPANALATNGQSIDFEVSGTFAANANNKRIRVKYGATTMFDTTALAINNGRWHSKGRIIRTGAATQVYYGTFSTSDALLVSTVFQGTAAETLSGAVTFKCTGEATSNDDVKQETNYIAWGENE